jgi:hypothetical protein
LWRGEIVSRNRKKGQSRQSHRLRNARDLKRKSGKRPPYDRVLIVCEGEKTEPQYFEEIRKINRVPAVHVRVLHSQHGTEPRQVVDYAEAKFRESGEYELVCAVFDRDDHKTYVNALDRAAQLDHALLNDEKQAVPFLAVPSVPCFELWLLLHFDDVQAFFPRGEIFKRLKKHLAKYEKGMKGTYAATQEYFEKASQRAARLRQRNNPRPGTEPHTNVDEIVAKLQSIVVG